MQTSALAALEALRSGRTTAESLVEAALARVEQFADLNAVAAVDLDDALGQARQRDRELAVGSADGALHGIPVTIKDLFATKGLPTRAGTRAPLPLLGEEAAAVARLRAAGAVILAKTNMHEIALGLTGENPWTGDVKNPLDPERQAGGSSSGSAVAVARGMGFASLGTDTGGSIRAPAALCGVSGFKPTHGLVPLSGALPLSPTCDHAGPLGLNMADVRLVTEVLAGKPLPRTPVERPRLGIPKGYLDGRLTKDMRLAWDSFLERISLAGAEMVEVNVNDLELTERAYSSIVRAEAAFVHRGALARRSEGFSPGVQAALEAGARVLAGEYLYAMDDLKRVQTGLRSAFKHCGIDALILPSTPSEAVRRGESKVDLECGRTSHREAQLALTAPFSMAGMPVAALPFAKINGLPVGVQVVTLWQQDSRALDVGDWIQGLPPGR